MVLTLNIIGNLVWVSVAMGGLKDLDSFLHSGLAFGQGLNPYGFHPQLSVHPISEEALNLNPPISLYLFEPLSRLDPDVARMGFILGSSLMVTLAVGMLLQAYPDKRSAVVVLAVISMAGIWHMLFYLQIYAPLILAITVAWLLMKRGDLLLAGLLVGLVIAIKPNYALVALVLFAAGHYRVAIAAGVSAGLISLVPLVLEGPMVYWQWLELSMHFEGVAWTSNASLMSVGAHFGSPMAGRLLAVLLVLGVVAFQWRVRPNVLDSTAIGLMVVLLFGPVSWAGYTLLLLPFLFSRPWNAPMWGAILLLDTPFSPHRAGNAIGSDILPSLNISLPSISFTPPPLITVPWDAVLGPALSAIYAWAVIVLLVLLVVTIVRQSGVAFPPPDWRERMARLIGLPRPAPQPGAASAPVHATNATRSWVNQVGLDRPPLPPPKRYVRYD